MHNIQGWIVWSGYSRWWFSCSLYIPCLTSACFQFSSVTQSCPTLCNPMNLSMPGLPVHHQLLEFTQTHVHLSVIPSSHLILCHPLLLPPIPPNIRVFSNESTLRMRHVHTAIFKMDNQRGPTLQHVELCSMLCGSLDGSGVWGRMGTCMGVSESLCCSPEAFTTLLISYTTKQKVQKKS